MSKKLKNNFTYYLGKQKNHFLIPVLATMAILPILVHCYVYNPHLENYIWNPDNTGGRVTADIYLYYRARFLCLAGFIMLPLLCYLLVTSQEEKKTMPLPVILLLCYAGFCIMASFMSIDKYFTIYGIWEQFESIFVLLAYVILTIYTFMAVNHERDIHTALNWLVVSTAILCVFGIFQLASYDLWETSFGKNFVFPAGLHYTMERTVNKGRVYFSFYNSNYVGFYTALVLPIFLTLFLFAKEKKKKLGYGFLILVMVLCLFGSMAKNGLLAVSVTVLAFFILFRNQLKKSCRQIFILIAVLCAALLIFLLLTSNPVLKNLQDAFKAERISPPLNEIRTGEDAVTVVYNKQELHIQLKEDSTTGIYCDFNDQSEARVEGIYDEVKQEYYFEDSRFSTIQVAAASIGGRLGIEVRVDGKEWFFTNETEDGTWYNINGAGKLCKLKNASSLLFTGYEGLFSGRGYIWSRSIPLLFEYFPFGSGPDTFQLAFPQTDYVMAYNYGYEDTIITKPHNLYIQIGVQTGMLSLAAFIAFYICYCITSLRLYAKNKFDTFSSQAGCGIFIGTIGYMVSGLVNDSTVCVSPYFWILIGLGLAINLKG